MAKFKHSVCIRIGAAYDDVTVQQSAREALHFDRAALGKARHEGSAQSRLDAKTTLYGLRKGVVDAFVAMQDQKGRRRNRRARKGYQNAIAA